MRKFIYEVIHYLIVYSVGLISGIVIYWHIKPHTCYKFAFATHTSVGVNWYESVTHSDQATAIAIADTLIKHSQLRGELVLAKPLIYKCLCDD